MEAAAEADWRRKHPTDSSSSGTAIQTSSACNRCNALAFSLFFSWPGCLGFSICIIVASKLVVSTTHL